MQNTTRPNKVFQPLVGFLVAMTGLFFYVVAPNGEYLRHLTAIEKAALAKGQPVLKAHRAYNNIWKTGYHEGPLRVEPQSAGKLKFIPHGHWQQFDEGHLSSTSDYKSPHNSTTRIYNEIGEVTDLIEECPVIVNGDSAVEVRLIYLNLEKLTDILFVNHWFRSFAGKPVGKDYWSFDVKGKRPVPEGWKFHRY